MLLLTIQITELKFKKIMQIFQRKKEASLFHNFKFQNIKTGRVLIVCGMSVIRTGMRTPKFGANTAVRLTSTKWYLLQCRHEWKLQCFNFSTHESHTE